jgi:hypothetical protein
MLKVHSRQDKSTFFRGLCSGALLVVIAVLCVQRSVQVQLPAAGSAEGSRPVRVAVCFFGLTRSLRYTIGSIRSNVLDALTVAGVSYTVYLHTHNATRFYNPRSMELNVTIDTSLYSLLHPDEAIVEAPMDWDLPSNKELLATLLQNGDPWNETAGHYSLKNVVGQLTSLQRLTSLWSGSTQKYDAVIYLRSDVWFFTPLNVSQVLEAAHAPNSQPVIWTPRYDHFGSVNDRFAFGNTAAMQIYGNRIQHAIDFVKDTTLHAETFLKHVLVSGNVTCLGTNILFSRVRVNGLVVEVPVVKADGTFDFTAIKRKFAHRMVWNSLGYWEIQPR